MSEKDPTFKEFEQGLAQLSSLRQLEVVNYAMSNVEVKESLLSQESSPELSKQVEQARVNLQDGLNERAKQLGSSLHFNLSSPEMPKDLSLEQLKVIEHEIFRNQSQLFLLPNPQELYDFNSDYQSLMYPSAQQAFDTQKGLVSKAPDWFTKPATLKGFDFQGETWSQAYFRNMQHELQTLKAQNISFVLLETTQKPNYTDGSQYYGSKEGTKPANPTQPSLDPLQSIFQQVFTDNPHRFNHTEEELTNELIPQLETQIRQKLQENNLQVPNFKIILAPAFLFNLQTTLFHPENSQTNTWERSSTPLLDKQGNDTVHQLVVGFSVHGGASFVVPVHRSSYNDFWGVRFAVVFYH